MWSGEFFFFLWGGFVLRGGVHFAWHFQIIYELSFISAVTSASMSSRISFSSRSLLTISLSCWFSFNIWSSVNYRIKSCQTCFMFTSWTPPPPVAMTWPSLIRSVVPPTWNWVWKIMIKFNVIGIDRLWWRNHHNQSVGRVVGVVLVALRDSSRRVKGQRVDEIWLA